MITATIDQTALDLPRQFTFELIQQSQLCSFSSIKGDCVPNISFPDTERNRNVLNHPNRFELKRDGNKEFKNFELRSEGFLLIRGTLVLTNNFSGFVRGQVGNLAQSQQDKLITDNALPDNQSFLNKTLYYSATDEYCAPQLINESFFAGIGADADPIIINPGTPYEEEVNESKLQRKHRYVDFYINKKDTDGKVYINNDPLLFEDLDSSSYKLTVVSPQLYLFYVIEKLLKLNGFYLTSNALATDADLKNLFVYNNFDITHGEQTLEEQDLGIERVHGIDKALSNSEAISLTRIVDSFDYVKLLPKVSLKEFLVGFQNLLNAPFIFKSNQTVEIVDREAIITSSVAQDLSSYFVGQWELGEKKDVALKFIQKHDDDDAIFSSNYVDLTNRLNEFAADVELLSELTAIKGSFLGELRRVKEVNAIYEWNYTIMTMQDQLRLEKQVYAWIFKTIDFLPGVVGYQPGKELEEIETSISTLANKTVPTTSQFGQSNLRKEDEAKFSLRVLFYYGSNNARNHTENYNLKFTGENNLIEKRWKYTANWWSTRQAVTGYFLLPANILQGFNLNEKKKAREGAFIIERMVTPFSHSGVGLTKVDGYKV